ncbi:hypothetical protein K8S19_00825 [bacterium]|nr:hypothetical protein [bacterium]
MPFCPQCGYEYRPEIKICPDCNERLVAALAPDPNQVELFETFELCKIPDEVTGMALQSMLLEAGVDANLRDMRTSFYANVLSSMQGYWGTIIVAKQDEDLAKQVHRDFKKQFEGR